MALSFFWRAEGTTLDATHDFVASGGDNIGTLNGGATIAAGAALVGSNGLLADGASRHVRFDTTTEVFDRLVGSFGFLLNVATWINNTRIVMIRGAVAADQYSIELAGASGAGNIRFIAGDPDGTQVSVSTTGLNLQPNTTYGVVVRWDHANNLLRVEVYGTPLGTPSLLGGVSNTSGYTAPSALATADRFRFGEVGGAAASLKFDNIFVSKVYAEPIQNNFAITSYTGYSAGSSVPTITDAGDESFRVGETGVTITGTNFGATQGGGSVIISPSDDAADVNAIAQTVTAWGDTSITIDVVRGTLGLNQTLYLFVENDGGSSNAAGYAVTLTPSNAVMAARHLLLD